MEEYLKERIKYLKGVEIDYFNKSVNEEYPDFERRVYRNFSKEFESRRGELEILLEKFFSSEAIDQPNKQENG